MNLLRWTLQKLFILSVLVILAFSITGALLPPGVALYKLLVDLWCSVF